MPCAIPTICTICGMFQIYFKGIAIPKSTRKEIASKVLINLKDFTESSTVLNFLQRYVLQVAPLNFWNILWQVHLCENHLKLPILNIDLIAGKRNIQCIVAPILFKTEMPPLSADGVEPEFSHPFKKQFPVGKNFF